MDWIAEAEDATSLVELNDIGSATGKVMPDFEVCGFHECERTQTKSTRDLQKESCHRRRNSRKTTVIPMDSRMSGKRDAVRDFGELVKCRCQK